MGIGSSIGQHRSKVLSVPQLIKSQRYTFKLAVSQADDNGPVVIKIKEWVIIELIVSKFI